MGETLLLTRRDVAELLPMADCIAAVEDALRAEAAGRTLPSRVLGLHAGQGSFHVKAAGLMTDQRALVAVKVNGNFPSNPERHGLPTIQGLIVLADADNGTPMAVLDSIEITALRTAAASALAVRYLAPAAAATATVVGCGVQGRKHLLAIAQERPLRRVWLVDIDVERAQAMADEMRSQVNAELLVTRDLGRAASESAVIVTCTTARAPVLLAEHVRPGTFVAAVGADNPQKQELEARLLAGSGVVADSLDQCAAQGELRHAIEAGLMGRDDVRAELSQVVTGERRGRHSSQEIVVFDSTGTALQDVAAVGVVYGRAVREGRGRPVDFFA